MSRHKIHLSWRNDGEATQKVGQPPYFSGFREKKRLTYMFEVESESPIERKKDAFAAIKPLFSILHQAATGEYSQWRCFFGLPTDKITTSDFDHRFHRRWYEGMISVDGNELTIFTNLKGDTRVDGQAIKYLGKSCNDMIPVTLEDGTHRLLSKATYNDEFEVFSFSSRMGDENKYATFADEMVRSSKTTPELSPGRGLVEFSCRTHNDSGNHEIFMRQGYMDPVDYIWEHADIRIERRVYVDLE